MAKTVPSTAVEQRTRAVVLELLDSEGQIEGETRSVRRARRRETGGRVMQEEEEPTRCTLGGLVDGDNGGGPGQAAGVHQADVHAVGARLREGPGQVHLALGGRRDVVTPDGSHLIAAVVRHDGAR